MTKVLSQLFLTLFVMLAGVTQAFAVSIDARVDTHKVEEGDSLILTVTVNERAFGKEPDFRELQEQFRIINKVNSSSVRMINGQMESSLSWRLTLSPKTSGYVVIPPIKYGNAQSKPITIQVSKRSKSDRRNSKDLVFIESTVDKKSVYVQEQLVLTLRLYRRTQLVDASWVPPEISDSAMEPLTESRTYQTTIGNYTYHVTENTFAVFPQKSGKLVVPESQLIATIGAGRRGFFDPFSNSGKQIRRTTERLEVEVKPTPDSYPKTHWLPSSQVALADHWSPENPQFKVGEAVTRTIILQAKGVTATALPSIPAPDGSNFKVYPDKADTQSSVDADGIVSQRVESYAFIPTEAGTITLPEIKVDWWDTTRDQLQTATLPAKTIEVIGSATVQRTDQTVSAPPSLDAATNAAPPSLGGSEGDTLIVNTTWQWIALVSSGLWLVTLIALIVVISKRKTKNKTSETDDQANLIKLKDAKKELKIACQSDDPHEIKVALVNWGKAMYPESSCYSLGDVSALVNSERCQGAIKVLEILLYKNSATGGNSHFDGTLLWEAIEDVEKQAQSNQGQAALEPLYPTA